MADSIGSYTFLRLRGSPVWPVEQQKVIQRAGVDGSAFLYLGKRSPPFQMESIVDQESMSDAAATMLLYQGLCDDPPVALVQGGVAWSDADLYVKVLDVQQKTLQYAPTVGGINPPSLVILEAVWTLQGLEYTPAGSS